MKIHSVRYCCIQLFIYLRFQFTMLHGKEKCTEQCMVKNNLFEKRQKLTTKRHIITTAVSVQFNVNLFSTMGLTHNMLFVRRRFIFDT